MTEKQFWHIQLHPNDPNKFNAEKILEILNSREVIGIGEWDDGVGTIEQFRNEMRIGDIVAVKSGGTPIALVEVIGEVVDVENPNETLDWFPIRRKVKILDIYNQSVPFKITQARGTLSICRDLNNPTSRAIISWYERAFNAAMESEITDLLKFKSQVILQGPPGTGKTRMAKIIAKKITAATVVQKPEAIVLQYLESFKPDTNDIQKRQKLKGLLKDFHHLFPKDKLKELSLDNYPIGKGESGNFCWWIERGLKEVGYYSPGSARSYLIFWKKEISDYSLHTKFLAGINDPEVAMEKVAGAISDFVMSKDFVKASKDFGDGFLLKLLHTYYPEEYFPVNSVPCLNNILKLLSIDYSDMNTLEKNLAIHNFFLQKKQQFKIDMTSLEFMNFLFKRFNIKGEMEVDQKGVVTKGEYKTIQFHPSYSYEDFVRGIAAKTSSKGNIYYEVENKILAEFAEKALNNPSANYVLIIDEINRANLSSVLGELIYALEYRFDENEPEETSVSSLYQLKSEDGEELESSKLRLPRNLLLIGTMNTADRSVSHIDYAIRRRFAYVDIHPTAASIETEKGKQLYKEVAALFIKWENGKAVRSNFIAPDFDPNDVQIGHSYFMGDEDKLAMRLKYEIKPILIEYLRDGVFLASARPEIDLLMIKD